MNNNVSRLLKAAPLALFTAALLAGCNSDSDNRPAPAPEPEQTRVHDDRTFTPVVPEITAMTGATVYTGTYDGSHGPAAYAIEVPDDWNGILVMYAHGYRGTGENLTVTAPSRIRDYLIANGYAWAASSYSANYYDVRAGVEDTNALALQFEELTAAGSHGTPQKYYIVGHSMGGHITGAAIEAETAATANNVVQYSAAMPLCGVMDETFQFDYLLSFTTSAQHLAGLGPTSFPAENYQTVLPDIIATLWERFPTWADASTVPGITTAQGGKLEGIVRNLSGGQRPIFAEGFRTPYQQTVMGTGGRDGTINGILARDLTSNDGVVYQFDNDPAVSVAEQAFNDSILRVTADADANPQRSDGLRWLPVINGEFSIPVLTMHTLGDLYVPFAMQQKYRQAAEANGNGDRLVQRAIRSPGHCDFTIAEEVSAFAALANWEQNGVKPGGDDVTTADVVAADTYGCAYTNNSTIAGVEDSLAATRASLPACP